MTCATTQYFAQRLCPRIVSCRVVGQPLESSEYSRRLLPRRLDIRSKHILHLIAQHPVYLWQQRHQAKYGAISLTYTRTDKAQLTGKQRDSCIRVVHEATQRRPEFL